MNSFRDVIDAFGVPRLADALGVKYVTAAAWRQRNRIPSAYWCHVAQAASDLRIAGITERLLAQLDDHRKTDCADLGEEISTARASEHDAQALCSGVAA